jgi:hypothetical protein
MPADLHRLTHEGVAVAVLAGQLRATAAQMAGDIRAGQPDRPGRSEPPIQEHMPAGLHPLSDQGVAVEIAAIQGQRAAKDCCLKIQAAANAHPSKPDPLCIHRPLVPDQ